VRFLVRDDEAQFERARRLVERNAGADDEAFVSLLVLLETEWVLRSRYHLPKNEIIEAIVALLSTEGISLEDESAIEEAVFHWRDAGADFADCLIGARNRRLGCRATATFDSKAERLPTSVPI
jgi:predicted nucleic-acid-binding protein